MNFLRQIAFLVFLAFVTPAGAAEPLDVSMVQLIAAPGKYHGKFVRVIGYLHLEFEGNALYLHREDHQATLFSNGIWFDQTPETEKRPKDFSDRYVLVEGTYNAKSRGHMGLWSGTISKVTRVMVWKSLAAPPKSRK